MKKYSFWTLFLLLFSSTLMAQNLSLSWVHELPKEIKQNIVSNLGGLPKNAKGRDVFIYTAKEKIKNALNAQGYYKATITTSIDKSSNAATWSLSLNITLNQATPLRKVDITLRGSAKEDRDFLALLQNANITSGDILDHGKYESLKAELLELGLTKGYFDQQLTQSAILLNKSFDYADIHIIYDSGVRYKFGDITFSDVSINKSLMDKFIPFEADEFYSVDKVQTLQKHLEQARYFNSVLVIPKKDEANNGYLPLNVQLTHTKSHIVNVGVGFSTDTKFNTSLGWRTPLINQWGHLMETKLVYSQVNPSALVNYQIPLTHPINDLLEVKLQINEDEFGDLESQYKVFQVGRLTNEDDWLKQGYIKVLYEDWFNGEYDDTGHYLIPGFSWFNKNKSGPLLDPTDGFSQYYNVEFAYEKAGSSTSFLRVNARFKYIKTLRSNHRLVMSTELGVVDIDNDNYIDVSPSLLFFAGGDQSIRGFGYQTVGPSISVVDDENTTENYVIGGTHMVTASLEYQYYFTDKIRGALFTDHGSVTRDFSLDHVYSVGTGIHYISPVGAMKLDFAYSLSEQSPGWRIHFNLGAEL